MGQHRPRAAHLDGAGGGWVLVQWARGCSPLRSAWRRLGDEQCAAPNPHRTHGSLSPTWHSCFRPPPPRPAGGEEPGNLAAVAALASHPRFEQGSPSCVEAMYQAFAGGCVGWVGRWNCVCGLGGQVGLWGVVGWVGGGGVGWGRGGGGGGGGLDPRRVAEAGMQCGCSHRVLRSRNVQKTTLASLVSPSRLPPSRDQLQLPCARRQRLRFRGRRRAGPGCRQPPAGMGPALHAAGRTGVGCLKLKACEGLGR